MAKLYRHYKSNLYEYIGECLHSETLEEMVKRFAPVKSCTDLILKYEG